MRQVYPFTDHSMKYAVDHLCKFSMEFQSGDNAAHQLLHYANVKRAACDGILFYMKIIFLQKVYVGGRIHFHTPSHLMD